FRSEGLRLLARTDPAKAIRILGTVLDEGTTADRQAAFSALGDIDCVLADALLAQWLDRLSEGKVPAAVQLDLIDAAEKREAVEVKKKLDAHEAALAQDDPLAPYRVALEGGNSFRGRQVFLEKTDVYCLRCHKVNGNGGEVGPDLSGIALEKDREYLL